MEDTDDFPSGDKFNYEGGESKGKNGWRKIRSAGVCLSACLASGLFLPVLPFAGSEDIQCKRNICDGMGHDAT